MTSFDIIRKVLPSTQQWKWYGIAAISLQMYGSRTVWFLQAQIIGQLQDEDALAFKRMACDECTMIAVAVGLFCHRVLCLYADERKAAIVAQIAITGLSLNALNQTHWMAKACFVMSLIFALVSVYYSVTQQRILGRLIKARDVRDWIRGRKQAATHLFSVQVGFTLHPCEPDDYAPEVSDIRDFKMDIQRQCFIPSPLSVITLSAPQILLSGSLYLLLIALGIYLGKFWVRRLDSTDSSTDARNVFIMYFIGLYFSGGMYVVLGWFHGKDGRSDSEIIDGYLNEYLANHPGALSRWNVDSHWRLQNGALEPINGAENEENVVNSSVTPHGVNRV